MNSGATNSAATNRATTNGGAMNSGALNAGPRMSHVRRLTLSSKAGVRYAGHRCHDANRFIWSFTPHSAKEAG